MKILVNKKQFDFGNIWFSSDFHLGHSNILLYSNRPFKDINDMDNTIISNINFNVRPDDALFYLGDFCFRKRNDELTQEEVSEKYRNRIDCKNIFFIWGNHDFKLRNSQRFRNLWTDTFDIAYLEINGQQLVLCHFAMRTWNKSHHGAWQLYGHSHGDLLEDKSFSFDVGVDCWKYNPISFNQVRSKMNQKTFGGASATTHHNKVQPEHEK